MRNAIHTLLSLSVSTTAVPTPILRRLRDCDVHGSAEQTNCQFPGVRAGPTMFLLFGRAYPDLTIAKDYGAHVLNNRQVLWVNVIPSTRVYGALSVSNPKDLSLEAKKTLKTQWETRGI